jgi:hypothetical protein
LLLLPCFIPILKKHSNNKKPNKKKSPENGICKFKKKSKNNKIKQLKKNYKNCNTLPKMKKKSSITL